MIGPAQVHLNEHRASLAFDEVLVRNTSQNELTTLGEVLLDHGRRYRLPT